MFKSLVTGRGAWLAAGLTVGVLAGVGVAVVIGVGIGQLWPTTPWPPATPVFATATHGSENLTIATGAVEPNLEAVIILDHITGELVGYVPNPNNGRFFVRYSYSNVAKDLGVTKNPKYSISTGYVAFKATSRTRLGTCVVYVAEESSGNVVAYGLPWDTGRKSSNEMSQSSFVKLDMQKVSSGARRGAGGAADR
jgi:hypothetical protein